MGVAYTLDRHGRPQAVYFPEGRARPITLGPAVGDPGAAVGTWRMSEVAARRLKELQGSPTGGRRPVVTKGCGRPLPTRAATRDWVWKQPDREVSPAVVKQFQKVKSLFWRLWREGRL
jgi:hypothetical protein